MEYVAYMDSLIGILKVVADEEALIRIDFVESCDENHGNAITTQCIQELQAYFTGERSAFDVPVRFISGTPFEQSVWNALRSIPYGETRSYKEVAIMCGRDKAARAIGMANHKNLIPIIIPCHRVIGAHGSMVGYAGGLDKKVSLLRLEQKIKKQ